jgi:hypothetical protein
MIRKRTEKRILLKTGRGGPIIISIGNAKSIFKIYLIK